MTCAPEKVTALVDAALDAVEAEVLRAHLALCPACAEQAEAERVLRARLHELPGPELPAGFELRMRNAVRPRRVPLLAALLPLAAMLVVAVWARGAAPVVALALALDHDKCFAHDPLPAHVWSDDPDVVAAWFEERGSRLPVVPRQAAGLELVGARFCPLLTLTSAPHLYYASAEHQVSLFVVPHGVRLPPALRSAVLRRRAVQLLRVAGTTVGIVGDREEEVVAFRRSFEQMIARRLGPGAIEPL
ncbi:MAG: zf-HC2 domain-containing protein [Vicinamibacteria bacterium]|nr:zf-HC2 domain-containing protein [Vicinamibacteria bacterium]